MRYFRRTLAATGTLLVLAIAGCGTAEKASTQASVLDATGAVAMDQDLHARLPESVRARGSMRLVTDASYAPMEYFAADGRTVIGFSPDLAAALGDVLGIRVDMVTGVFSTALDEVDAGTYDGVLSSMTDTPERRDKADFVDYLNAGTAIVVQRGNPRTISAMKDLCGQKVATEHGTLQEEILQRLQKKECAAWPIVIDSRRTNADALVQLRTGRVAAVLIDSPPAAYLVADSRTSAFYQLANDEQYEPGQFGIAVDKENKALRDCLQAALQRLIDSGTYTELLTRWGLQSSGVTEATVNGASKTA
ncbi:ABC transporter substrate-binding protein [Actinoplanes sp. NPDC051861]|uniref:ABC transporter substrate-binding protein n=1 Tax=Actinoplanes sp. NPDC051861 TaxID=3155170 RepID=UPI0034281D80